MSRRSPSKRTTRTARKAASPQQKQYDQAGKLDDVSCPYPKHRYSCEPMRKKCVKQADDCLTLNLEDFKRVKRQWQSPKKRSASRRRKSMTKVWATETYVPAPRARSVKKALSPSFLAEVREQAYPLRGLSPIKRYSSPKKTAAVIRRRSSSKKSAASRRRSLTRKMTRTHTIRSHSNKTVMHSA